MFAPRGSGRESVGRVDVDRAGAAALRTGAGDARRFAGAVFTGAGFTCAAFVTSGRVDLAGAAGTVARVARTSLGVAMLRAPTVRATGFAVPSFETALRSTLGFETGAFRAGARWPVARALVGSSAGAAVRAGGFGVARFFATGVRGGAPETSGDARLGEALVTGAGLRD